MHCNAGPTEAGAGAPPGALEGAPRGVFGRKCLVVGGFMNACLWFALCIGPEVPLGAQFRQLYKAVVRVHAKLLFCWLHCTLAEIVCHSNVGWACTMGARKRAAG
jgi:hypothetical protein